MTTKVFIATPMYGGVCHGDYTNSLINLLSLLSANNIPCMYRFLYNESLITRARDTLVHDFLKTDCTHLLFIDSDIVINPDDVLTLINENKSVIGGCYPKKNINFPKVVENVKNGIPIDHILPSSLEYVFNVFEDANNILSETTKVKDTGTGYLLIKRQVFEKLKKITPYYSGNYMNLPDEQVYAFFQTSIDDCGNLLSEDYHFCKKYRSIGGNIYVCPNVRAKHIGTFYYG